MKRSYPTSLPSAKFDQAAFMQRLEILCRIKLSELFQAVLEAEVDQALERVRYERRGDDGTAGYRDGHDRPRTISSNRGPITIARPRVRGAPYASAVLPKHRRRLENVDRSVTDLWLDGLATRDFEGTLRAFLAPKRRSRLRRSRGPISACASSSMHGMLDDSTILNSSSFGLTACILALALTTSGACS